jgi:acetyl-CoA synthetase
MTRGLYGDDERYIETYWSRWPDVWVQGDLASVEDGAWFLHGRSDDTIMLAGKRLGPIEPEAVAVRHPAIVEAAAVGGPHDVKGEELVLFVVGDPTVSFDRDLVAADVSTRVAAELGAAFRPADVLFVDALPKTRSGKVMRRLVRDVLFDRPLGDMASLDDHHALDQVRAACAVRRNVDT